VLNAAGVSVQSNVRANRLIPSPRQPITAASTTMASGDVADSTTAVDSRSPDRLATSSIRQMTQE